MLFRSKTAADAAATRVQACFRGHSVRSSGSLPALRRERVLGRKGQRPAADDADFRRALMISPSVLLDAAFTHIDTNGDDKLTFQELQTSAFASLLSNRWHKLDADKNGLISRDEWNTYFAKIRKRAIAKAGMKSGEQQYHRFVAALVWQAMVDISSIEACMRACTVKTPATSVSAPIFRNIVLNLLTGFECRVLANNDDDVEPLVTVPCSSNLRVHAMVQVHARAEAAALARIAINKHAENENVVQAAQKLANLLGSCCYE